MIEITEYVTDLYVPPEQHYKVHYKACQFFRDNENVLCAMFNYMYVQKSMTFMDIANLALIGTAGFEGNPFFDKWKMLDQMNAQNTD